MQADQLRSGRRPALIPRGVSLTTDEEAALKTRVGDNVIPPPDPFIADWTIRIPKRGSEEKIQTPGPLLKKLRTTSPQESESSDGQIRVNDTYILQGSQASGAALHHGYEYVFLPDLDALHLKDKTGSSLSSQDEQAESRLTRDQATAISEIATADEVAAESLFRPDFNYNSSEQRSTGTRSGVIT